MLVSVQLPDREVEQLDEIVRARGQSRAAFIREAVRHKLSGAAPAAPIVPPRPVRVRRRKPAKEI
jgi:metal-responsive CopG/Arc/MetJ family transcriptional regulator